MILLSCKSICEKHKVKRTMNPYQDGQKYCNDCRTWIKWDGLRCPCCSHVLRTKARRDKKRVKELYSRKYSLVCKYCNWRNDISSLIRTIVCDNCKYKPVSKNCKYCTIDFLDSTINHSRKYCDHCRSRYTATQLWQMINTKHIREYRSANKEYFKDYSKKYWIDNKDRLSEKHADWYQKNKDRLKQKRESNVILSS